MKWHRLLGLLTLLTVLGAASSGNTQDLKLEKQRSKRPVLGQHRFVANELTREAFPRTYIQTRMGIGQALDVEILPTFTLESGDTLDAISGDLMVAVLDIDYQYALKDWMSVYASVSLVARMGTNAGALLSEGATVISGFELGWLLRLLERENYYLSGTVDVVSSSFTGVSLIPWVEGIVDDTGTPLVRTTPAVRVGAGLRFAWAINDLFGFNAATRLGYGEGISNRRKELTSFKLAVVGDLDLHARTSTPIGFALGGQFSNTPRDGSDQYDTIWQALLRIAYTGRDDFLLALDLESAWLDASALKPITTGTVLASMRYYF